MGKSKKLVEATEKAIAAFWEAVKEEYPDVEGSLPDNLELKFHIMSLKCIDAWKR